MLQINIRMLMAHQKIDNVAHLSKITNVAARPLHNLYKETEADTVKLGTLMRICDGLGCKLSDLVEYIPEK